MEESSMFRAITIAVAVFVAIATITAVLSYYNTAKAMVQTIGTGTDYDLVYSDYVENVLLKADANTTITGEEVINLANYFHKNEKVQINVKMTPLYNNHFGLYDSEEVTNVNNSDTYVKKALSRIIPSEKFNIIKRNEDGILIIDITRLEN